MISPLRLIVLTLTLASGASNHAAEPTAPAAKATVVSPYAPVDFLVDGLWIATLPPNENGVSLRIELRFSVPENHEGIRFDSAWVNGDKRAPYTSGMYAWDGAKEKLVIFYTDSRGGLTQGTVAQEDNVLVHELTVTSKDGKTEPIRVRLTKENSNEFTNEIFTMKDGAWAKFVEVSYKRSK